MARSRLPCCDGHHGFAFLRRLDAELFEKGAESHQPGGGAMRCDPNAQSVEKPQICDGRHGGAAWELAISASDISANGVRV
jgi:hypothetical protein